MIYLRKFSGISLELAILGIAQR